MVFMKITIEEINEGIIRDANQFISVTDANYFSQLRKIVQYIFDNRFDKPIILLSGPSGSGKTTSAHLLESFISEMGHKTHTLSMDNYFHTLSDYEKIGATAGTLDLESPSRLNTDLLNAQLTDIINLKPVHLPIYDFPSASSIDSGRILARKPNELVILEGIHALNPDVITIPDQRVVKIYVSVRTRIVCENHIIHPENVRLLRRMIRDNIHRGRTFSQTCIAAENVKRGEDLYVMPYKYRSDFDIDTFIPYELGVYKSFFRTQLLSIESHGEMAEILRLLTPAYPLSESLVPKNSLIREFIGE